MKNYILLLVVIINFVFCVDASAENKVIRKDGYWWNNFNKLTEYNEVFKELYVSGYVDGLLGTAEVTFESDQEEYKNCNGAYEWYSYKMKEIYNKPYVAFKDGLNVFYKDPFNYALLFPHAIHAVALKLNGYGEFADCVTEIGRRATSIGNTIDDVTCIKLPNPYINNKEE